MNQKECEWYLDGFCCKDLDSGRVWNCTAPNKEMRIKISRQGYPNTNCPYPKLGNKK